MPLICKSHANRVVGTVVATQKNRKLEGAKLLLVQPLTLDDRRAASALLAIDSVGAGVGEKVLVVIEGKAAGEALGGSAPPSTPRSSASSIAVDYERRAMNEQALRAGEQAIRAMIRRTRHLGPLGSRMKSGPNRRSGRQPLIATRCRIRWSVPDRAGRAVQSLRILRIARTLIHGPAEGMRDSATPRGLRLSICDAMVKPAVLLTRRIPSAVLSRLEAAADVDSTRACASSPTKSRDTAFAGRRP